MRAIARELIGKVPFGGGLIPKAAIAYAATFALGLSMERLYRLGYGFTRDERRHHPKQSTRTAGRISPHRPVAKTLDGRAPQRHGTQAANRGPRQASCCNSPRERVAREFEFSSSREDT